MKRILVVNVNWLGDTLFVTPFIRALKEHNPSAYIAVLTHPRCREILECNRSIDEIIVYNEKSQYLGFLSRFSMISKLRSKNFDTAFILRKSLSRTMMLFLSNIKERIGYDNRKSGFLLTKKVPLPEVKLHKVEYFLGLAKAVGIKPKNRHYEFFVSRDSEDDADRLLQKEGIRPDEEFIAMNAGGNWDLKRWPVENFIELGSEASKRFNIKVVLTGAKKDVDLCNRIEKEMKHKPVVLCGKTDLKTLAAVFKRAKKVISNDSGPSHIAAGVGADVLVIFGPTDPNITGPCGRKVTILKKDVGCEVPCYRLLCKDNKCMKAVTVKDVLELIN